MTRYTTVVGDGHSGSNGAPAALIVFATALRGMAASACVYAAAAASAAAWSGAASARNCAAVARAMYCSEAACADAKYG